MFGEYGRRCHNIDDTYCGKRGLMHFCDATYQAIHHIIWDTKIVFEPSSGKRRLNGSPLCILTTDKT